MRCLLLLLLLVLPVAARGGPETPMVVPEALTYDVKTLAEYLTSSASTPRLKAERIFLWITANINYDIPMLRATRDGGHRDCSPATVLKRRQSVCQGYANLFQALGRQSGLEVEVIGGWARSSATSAGDSHAWNAVKLDGNWELVDCTWGAGFVRGDDFHRSFAPFYFLTSPKELITSHFPQESRWQLLDNPISRAEYEQLTPIRPYSSGVGQIIPLQPYTSGGGNQPSQASPPAIQAAVSLATPRQLASYTYRGARLIRPTSGTLKSGSVEFHLEVPLADRVLVTTGGQSYALLPAPGKVGQFRALVPVTSGPLRVLAEFGASGRLEQLLEYEVR